MSMRGIKLVLGSLCLVSHSFAAAEPVAVQLGDVHLEDHVQVLQLGNTAPGVTSEASLHIPTFTPDGQVRVYCDGPFLKCRWADRDERTDRPSPGGTLAFRFEPKEVATEPHTLIITDQRGKPQVLIVVHYLMFKTATIAQTFKTSNLASGLGKDWGPWYDVCSGPAPPGYTVTKENFEIEGGNRGCHSWGECNLKQSDNENVCYEFRLQGKEAKFPDAAEIVKAQGNLQVSWVLIPTPPRLERVPPPAE